MPMLDIQNVLWEILSYGNFMNYNDFEKNLDLVSKHYYENQSLTLKKIENLFKEYLKEHPNDSEVSIRYAIFLLEDLHDDYGALEPLKKIIDNDPNNVEAVLIMGYIIWGFMGYMYEDYTFQRLNELKTDDPELLSMIEYVKYLYYSMNNNLLHQECLKKSVEFYDKHVKNNYRLGLNYGKETEIGKIFIKKAINNVQSIYIYLFPSFTIRTKEDFLNEFVKGTHITNSIYEMMKESLDS